MGREAEPLGRVGSDLVFAGAQPFAFFGKLDPRPIVATKPRLGQDVTVSYDKIREHIGFSDWVRLWIP
jgi:hypothetical protein